MLPRKGLLSFCRGDGVSDGVFDGANGGVNTHGSVPSVKQGGRSASLLV